MHFKCANILTLLLSKLSITTRRASMINCILPIKTNLTRTGAIPVFTEGLYELADGIYSWMVPNGSWGESNHGLIVGRTQSTLIDTSWDIKLTKSLLERIEPFIHSSPITKVINTHGDGDHCWGNQLFKDREIIASTATQQGMYHVKPEMLQLIKKTAAVAKHIPVPRCKHFGQWFTHMLGPYDYQDVTITPATTTFNKELTVNCDQHELNLFEMDSSHTDGDTFVYLPKEEILFSGDILFIQGTPVLWAGTPDNWIKALNSIIELNPKIIVPGHGYFTDIDGVKALINYWEYVGHHIEIEFARGLTAVEAAYKIALSDEFKQLGYLQWDAAERIVTSATTLYRHCSSTAMGKASIIQQLKMFSHQAELAILLKTRG